MNRDVEWGPADRDESRPFAHLEHNGPDVAALAVMAARLRQFLLDHANVTPYQPYELHSPQGRRLRLVINQPLALRTVDALPLVGFFGLRRTLVTPELSADKDTIDLELIAEFPQYPGVLAYCSMALDDANYGNLVLMAQPETNAHWSTSARHAFASRVIAPQYYSTVRLHIGRLPGGLPSGQDPVLLRTKYYDYQGDWHWSAVREYGAG
jgi:hypothetical protein